MTVDAPHPVTSRDTRERRARPLPRALATLAVLGSALALSACGLRFETPEPAEPAPDSAESTRAHAVEDAMAVQRTARAAAASTADPLLVAELTRIADFADQHVEALGGVYDSGLGDPSAGPTPTPEAGDPTPGAVVEALTGAADRAHVALDEAGDGDMARLLASIETSQRQSLTSLAALVGDPSVEAPTVPGITEAASGQALATVISTEDAAGYLLEIHAALQGDRQAELLAVAATHRATAEGWARAAGLAGTDDDPRRVAYELPAQADPDALMRETDLTLAEAYAWLVADSPAGSRGTPARFLLLAETNAVARGADPVAFPGMPEASPRG